MSNSQELQDIISESSKKSLLDAQVGADKLNKTLQETIVIRKQLNDTMVGAKTMGDVNAVALKEQKAIEATNKVILQKQILQERLIAVELANQRKRDLIEAKQTKADNERIASLQRKTKTIISNSQAEVDAYNKSVKAEGNYIALGQKASKAEALAANEAVVLSGKRQQAQIQVNEVITKQIDITEALGKKTSLIDRIGKGANTAFSALRKVAYILPGVGIAGLLGFAIDPIIDYISQLDIFSKKLSEIQLRRKEISDTNLKGAQNAQQEIVQLKTLYDTAKNVSLASDLRYNAAKKLQEQYPETFKNYSIEQIELGKVDAGYLKLTQTILATARARASQDKIAENSGKILEFEEKNVELQKERVILEAKVSTNRGKAKSFLDLDLASQRKLLDIYKQQEENKNEQNKLNQKNLDLTRNIVIQQLKGADVAGSSKTDKKAETDARASAAARIQSAIDAQKEIQSISKRTIDDENASLQLRLDMQEKFDAAGYQIVELTAKKEIAIKKRTADEIKSINNKISLDKVEVDSQSLKTTEKLYSDADNKLTKLLIDGKNNANAILRQQVSDRREAINAELEDTENLRAQLEQDANQRYADGLLSKQQYEDEIYNINRESAKKNLEIQIKANDEIIELQQSELDNFGIGNQKDINENLRKNTALKIRLSKLGTDEVIRNLEREKEARKAVIDKEKELLQEVFSLGKDLISQSFDNRLAKLEQESELIEQNKNLQIENVNESVASEQQKAEQIAVINQNAANQQEQIDQKTREIKRRQAIADKAAAIAQVIINIALAQTKTLATTGILGLPLNAIIAGIGAIQIAAILAQPIPKFEKGGTVQKDGIIMTGEKGQELRIDPDGSKYLTAGEANLSFAKAGTKIFSANHPNTINMLAKPDKMDVAGKSWDVNPLIAESQNSTKRIEKAIGKLATKNNRRQNSLDVAKTKDWLAQNGMKGL